MIALNEIGPRDRPQTGAKAAGLAAMIQAKLPVPDGFCVTSAQYRRHLEENDVLAKIETMLAAVHGGNLANAAKREALADVRRAIIDAPVAEDVALQIQRHLTALDAGWLAVRSSATAEDLPGHSFAGQHGTYFVLGLEACMEHVKHCWASLWTERAFGYRAAHGFDHADVEMAVVVQTLIDADASGVLFTADPVTGRSDRLTCEACFGLGEALVSGKVSPDRFVISRDSREILERRIADKTVEVRVGDDGTSHLRQAGLERATTPCVSPAEVVRVAELGMRAEKLFASPLDIEWALEDGDLYLLQARPITTLPSAPDRTIWSNANAGEVLPDVVSPMTWSIIECWLNIIFTEIFDRAGVDLGGQPIVGLIAGRGYFNISVLAAAMRQLTVMKNLDLDQILGGMQGRQDLTPIDLSEQELPRLASSRMTTLLSMPGFITWFLSHSPLKAEPFVRIAKERAKAALEFDSEPDEDAVAARIKQTIDDLHGMHHSIAFSTVGFSYFANLSVLCRRWLGDADGTLASRLLAGLGGMASAEAGRAMWRLSVSAHDSSALRDVLLSGGGFEPLRPQIARVAGGKKFLQEWDDFMREHGHHARGEIDVMNPRWSDMPDYVLDTVRGYLRAPAKTDSAMPHKTRTNDRLALEAECRRRLANPAKRALFNFVLRRAQLGCVVRENTKNEGVRYIAALRRLLFMLGDKLVERGVLERADDIFFLRLEELDRARSDDAFGTRGLITERRAQYEYNCTLDPPPIVVGTYEPTEHEPPPSSTGGTLTGLAVSSGIATGPARVILRFDDEQRLLPGEILVAPFTDPGWTPYFIPAAGIVMDMGGMLSHGSICAREYGIPAVVNVGPATGTIKTGQIVMVDAQKGEVKVLEGSG